MGLMAQEDLSRLQILQIRATAEVTGEVEIAQGVVAGHLVPTSNFTLDKSTHPLWLESSLLSLTGSCS